MKRETRRTTEGRPLLALAKWMFASGTGDKRRAAPFMPFESWRAENREPRTENRASQLRSFADLQIIDLRDRLLSQSLT